jgi:hypothetical protein
MHRESKKLCDTGKSLVVCEAKDTSESCAGPCSNDSPKLGRYALCENGPECGHKTHLTMKDGRAWFIQASMPKGSICTYTVEFQSQFAGL